MASCNFLGVLSYCWFPQQPFPEVLTRSEASAHAHAHGQMCGCPRPQISMVGSLFSVSHWLCPTVCLVRPQLPPPHPARGLGRCTAPLPAIDTALVPQTAALPCIRPVAGCFLRIIYFFILFLNEVSRKEKHIIPYSRIKIACENEGSHFLPHGPGIRGALSEPPEPEPCFSTSNVELPFASCPVGSVH